LKRVYENTRIRVFWDRKKCFHSAICLNSLPAVFNHNKRPWVKIDAADPEDIAHCIDHCPSGALSYQRLNKSKH
jgi:uncharacterized Fe-S cluster protein YjdI